MDDTVMGRLYHHSSGHESSTGARIVLIAGLAILAHLTVKLIRHISEANLLKKSDKITEILPMIATLREAWEQVPAEFANTTSIPVGNEGHAFSLQT